MTKKLLTLAITSMLASGTALADKQTVWYEAPAGSLDATCLKGALTEAVDPDSAAALAAALSYVDVSISAAADFEVTWHGNNGAVFNIDLAGALTQGTIAFTVAGAGAEAAVADLVAAEACKGLFCSSAFGLAEAGGGADAGGIAASVAAASSMDAMLSKVTVNAANINEFKGTILMGGLQGAASGSFVSEMADVLVEAGALACTGLSCDLDFNYEEATAAAKALAGAIGGSAIGVGAVAHYKKLPGNKSTDIIDLKTGAIAILGCASGAITAAEAN